VPGGSVTHIAPNVFYLASRLVDKLWQGVFKKEPEEIFSFIIKLVNFGYVSLITIEAFTKKPIK
jgi:hypothetical protein